MTAKKRTEGPASGSFAAGSFVADWLCHWLSARYYAAVCGSPLAADPVWRELQASEAAARLAHQPTRHLQRAKSDRVHSALAAGAPR